MTDADKIKYLEGWVEKLGAERDMYKSAWTFQDRQGRELTERVKQLESELAAAKAANPMNQRSHDVEKYYKDEPKPEATP